ncbi:glutathione S-transferase family protein [Xenorhabdus szentirmaii]|uniref:Glutathione S-transferase protein n=1 Tax=Xenorhabdus szentirmaii DSM 16338 TaxID=1427518 RepID=W1IVE7_9GAMM|nr:MULTISPECIES: glutathione S-transferase family protein [Xenorhabdus]MBD2793067.1 glutathione S-transferase family protein [Xenorhabdus sp. CUL]MBD2820766.1 glutathione S-transferase family protein [Xenorhabdus sp. 42]MBD2824526.1 glutathione S-transferase family protein [Xenorhabdus sp. 5]PHM32886.1 glutathione S-transferase [Xenorhabdus szentirmaii DSM 16338]PHM40795.1 glutathione S-transferase [Xenorhabdus szentirmaii]
MITVWGRKTSSNVQALMWCIGELSLPFTRYDIGHKYGGNDTSEFLSMNPNGKVPVIKDGDGEPIWETGATLRYLANRYAKSSPFWPEDLETRTHIDKWAEWSKINVALNFTVPIFWQMVRTVPQHQNQLEIEKAINNLNNILDIAETQLRKHQFIAGDHFTLADIQFGHTLYRYFDLKINHPKHSALIKYYNELTERPAFKEHVMISYEELRVI